MQNSPARFQFPPKLELFFRNDHVRYRVAYGGRSGGKSWGGIGGIVYRTLKQKTRVLCCREFQKSIKESVKKTIEDTIERLGLSAYYTFKVDSIVCCNGSEIIFYGLHANVSNIKSLEGVDIAYVEEAEAVTQDSWNLLIPTIRARDSEIWIVFNPRFEDDATYQMFVIDPPENSEVVKINYTDNPFCPDVMLAEAEEMKRKNLALYRHIWLGECRTENENALWKMATMIDPYRVSSYPELERLVIAIDPAVTNTEKSDETGIVAVGCAKNAHTNELHYYVLEDASGKGSPNEWARKAINLFDDYEADRIVVEVNNGGDLVESVMRSESANIPLTSVRATRGKIRRAEPIAALYERGLVHHVGVFPEMEDEMCNYCGTEKESSPDRMDALVWALTYLSSGNSESSGGSASGMLG